MRFSQHVFISRWYEGPPSPPKVTDKYVNASAKIVHEGVCFSVPPGSEKWYIIHCKGELKYCEDFVGKEHDILWNYVPWSHWGESMTKYPHHEILKGHYEELYKLFPKELPEGS